MMGAQLKHEPTSTPLRAKLEERIAREGAISVHDYMEACLADRAAGYYLTRQPIGLTGDFITAPEISQIFGELIGAWVAAMWRVMGAPERVVVAELGPGRGTLLADALRVFKAVPGLLESMSLALIETSPVLREIQRETLRASPLPPRWFDGLEDIPHGPLIVIANEFVDALPIRQWVRAGGTWRERGVGLTADGGFAFGAGAAVSLDALPAPLWRLEAVDGTIVETRPGAKALIHTLAARAEAAPMAALFVDYGYAESGPGDTLQAVRAHLYADPLEAPGVADLTAHVDFAALKETASALGLATFGPMPQGEFLLKLGLEARLARLSGEATGAQAEALRSGAARLADPRQMGALFKVLAVQSSGLAPAPPFGDI